MIELNSMFHLQDEWEMSETVTTVNTTVASLHFQEYADFFPAFVIKN